MRSTDRLRELAAGLVADLTASGRTVALAESCTGGWIAKSLTDIAGSSACLGYGIVSYSDAAKQALLAVPTEVLREHGAVSEATVLAMAGGVLAASGADFSIAVSGIAGPTGGSADKPVGTVWFAWAVRQKAGVRAEAVCHRLYGDRDAVREQSVELAMAGLLERLRAGA